MPVGAHECADAVFSAMFKLQPRRVLDLGIGYGFWGALCRNYFGTDPATGAIEPHAMFKLAGVECWPAYRNPMWGVYDHIILGRIEDHLDLLPDADLVIAVDVIEHLEQSVGERILTEAKAFVVGLPVRAGQGVVYGNEAERHLSHWDPAMLRKFASRVIEMPGFNPLANPGVDYMIGIKP